MAEDKTNNEKKGSIVKIAILVTAGLVLLGVGLGIGALIFSGGSDPDPSSEINDIIDKKTGDNEKPREDDKKSEDDQDGDPEIEMDCTENEDGEEECVPKKKVKKVNVEEKFLTTYYEFPGNFTTNLKDSRKFLQVTVGVSTQYDEEVMLNVESHMLALRAEILAVMSEFSEEEVVGREGKKMLSNTLKDALNIVLMDLEGFGGVEGVHFTSFVLQ